MLEDRYLLDAPLSGYGIGWMVTQRAVCEPSEGWCPPSGLGLGQALFDVSGTWDGQWD